MLEIDGNQRFSAPYHPATHGQAENVVITVKKN